MTTLDLPYLKSTARVLPRAARVLFSVLEKMQHGSLTVITPDGLSHRFGITDTASHTSHAELILHDWTLCRDVLTGGDVAFAEGYMNGRWDTPSLTTLLTVIAINQQALAMTFYGRSWQRLLLRLRHLLRSNTLRQARRNIVAHYDLGNAFYGLWLDRTMTYSSALFGGDRSQSLADAQQAKYARVLAEIAPAPDAKLVELGCGWGGFAEYAVAHGASVLGVSLSDAQTSYARARLAACENGARASFAICDYRHVTGAFDGIASIEMFEAVGERYWPAYFRSLRRALNPKARACVQTITIADDRFLQYRACSDFIQQYIFPGGMLASPSAFKTHAEAAGLCITGEYAFGDDYAETLKRWLAGFELSLEAVRAQGFDARFIKCWRFYLAYCVAGFESKTTDVAQYTLIAA